MLVPDLPGFGESDALPTGAAFYDLVETVALTLDILVGAGTCVDLAGFSFGGVVAGCLAQRRGGVRRMALLGAVGHGMRRGPSSTMLHWRGLQDEQTVLATMRHNLGMMMLHGPVDSLAVAIHYCSCVRARFKSKRTSVSPILTDVLAGLDMPVLMLWGEHDMTGDAGSVGLMWQGGRPDREYEVVPGAGHWVQYEAAGTVNRRLVDWFSAQ